MMTIEVGYYTDPACEQSWGREPQLRKLVLGCLARDGRLTPIAVLTGTLWELA